MTASVRSADPGQRRALGNIFKFLALLLALTLIARGTSSATLAIVEISQPSRSSIVEAITGSAAVSSRENLDVMAPEGLTIVGMTANVGQSLKIGDTIATFDTDEVEEKLLRETVSLEKMLLDLEKLDRPETVDNSSIESARRSLQRAREDYDITRSQGAADIATARDALDEALNDDSGDADAAALQTAIRNLRRAQEDYDSTEAQGEADIAAAQEALEDEQNSDPAAADHSQVESAQRSLQRANEDYNTTRAQGNEDVAAAWDSLYALQASGAGDREIDQAWSSINSAQRRADDNLTSAKRRVEDAEISLEKAVQDYNRNVQQAEESKQTAVDRAMDSLESARKRAEDNLLSAGRRVEDAEVSMASAEQSFSRSTEQLSETKQNAIDKAQEALESAQKRADDNLLSARRRVEDAEVSLANAEQNYQKNEQQTQDSSAQNDFSASTLRLDIDAQKTTVDTLEELLKNDGILYSSVEGVVSSVMPAGSVTSRNPLISFRDGAKGFEAQMQLSASDADKLAVGDECEVTAGGGSMYFTPTVTGTISGISLPDANDKVTVTIRLPDSDWTQGQRVEAQVVLSSGNYDLCVPVSALHSDNSGYYLLTVEKQSTVLGLQNVVMRIDVNVAASDRDNVSVRGSANRDSQVITSSNKAVTAGDRVRING